MIGKGQLFHVPDISCNHCVETIVNALKKNKDVKEVNINLKRKIVEVTGSIHKEKAAAVIKKAGYTVGPS